MEDTFFILKIGLYVANFIFGLLFVLYISHKLFFFLHKKIAFEKKTINKLNNYLKDWIVVKDKECKNSEEESKIIKDLNPLKSLLRDFLPNWRRFWLCIVYLYGLMLLNEIYQNQPNKGWEISKTINSSYQTSKGEKIKIDTLKAEININDEKYDYNTFNLENKKIDDWRFSGNSIYVKCLHKLNLTKKSDTSKDTLILIEQKSIFRSQNAINESILNWLSNLFNLGTALFLFLCYLSFSMPTQSDKNRDYVEIYRTYKNGGVFFVTTIVVIGLLVNLIDFYTINDYKKYCNFFGYISGLSSSFAVFLLAGKLDSKLLSANRCEYFQIILLYLYGAIQPLYFIIASNENEYAILLLLALALILKVSMYILIHRLISNDQEKPIYFIFKLRYIHDTQKEDFEKLIKLREYSKIDDFYLLG